MGVKLEPLEDRIVLQVDAAEEVTTGGIVLPGAAQRDLNRGKVVAVGPGLMQDNGVRLPMEVKAGDHIQFSRYSGADVKIDGELFKVIRQGDVLAKLV